MKETPEKQSWLKIQILYEQQMYTQIYIKAKLPVMLMVLFSNPRNTTKKNILKFAFLFWGLNVQLVGRKEKEGDFHWITPKWIKGKHANRSANTYVSNSTLLRFLRSQ